MGSGKVESGKLAKWEYGKVRKSRKRESGKLAKWECGKVESGKEEN